MYAMEKKENYLRAIYRKNPSWVPYDGEAVITVYSPMCERPSKAGRDVFHTKWEYDSSAEGGTYPSHQDFVITDILKWNQQVKFPNPDEFDWSKTAKEASLIDRDKFLVGGFVEMGIFERTYLLMGMEEALMAYYTNPKEMEELCSAIADYKISVIKKYYEAAQIDILWYGDDWGTQNNLFLSHEIWRKIIKPHTKRILQYAKSLGIIVNQHSCGKIESIIPDLIEMGADIWNPCQPCNDLAKLKKLYGDQISFCGGIDSQFVLANPQATVQDVVTEVKKRIQEMALPNGGYIAAPSHGVPYSQEKQKAMEDTIRYYGKEIYKS